MIELLKILAEGGPSLGLLLVALLLLGVWIGTSYSTIKQNMRSIRESLAGLATKQDVDSAARQVELHLKDWTTKLFVTQREFDEHRRKQGSTT